MLPRKLKLFVALTAMIALFAVTVPTIPFIVNIASGVSPTGIVVTEEEAVISTYESLLPSVVSILITERVSNDLGEVSLQETGGGTGFF
ncbi:MAG: hypothetical protein U1C53_02045, partial [Candidatus Veblenbacteria bacterium]|nr:hypothetical protein [Candidatus Veblenbacteria bacterium]